MIIFSSRRLEAALAEGRLSQWQKVKYLILPAVISGPAAIAAGFVGVFRTAPQDSLVRCLLLLLNALITYRGIKRCFLANETSDGEAFFERFAVLSVPVLVKTLAAVLAVMLPASGLIYSVREAHPSVYCAANLIFPSVGPVYVWAYYGLLRRSFRRLGARIEGRDTSPALEGE